MANKYAAVLGLSMTIFSGVVATLTLGSLPVFIARISQAFDLNFQQSGMLATADLGGCAIGCVISLFIQDRMRWRVILACAITLTCFGGLFSILSTDYTSLLASRFVTGFGNGFIVSLVFAALCATSNPDRNFGLYTLGQLIAQAITIPFFTIIVARFNVDAIFVALALASAATFLALPFFPTNISAIARNSSCNNIPVTKHEHNVSIVKLPLPQKEALIPLVALCIYFWAFSAVWTYFDAIGQSVEMPTPLIGKALGIASLLGILGPIFVIILQPHIMRNMLLALGIAAHVLSIFILLAADGYWTFLCGGSLFIFSLNFVFPFQMGILSKFDVDGSTAVIALVIQLACLATGPYIGGALYTIGGQVVLLGYAALSFVVSLLLFLTSSTSTAHLAKLR
jgi:predicted MFS family arabinose efflux permease